MKVRCLVRSRRLSGRAPAPVNDASWPATALRGRPYTTHCGRSTRRKNLGGFQGTTDVRLVALEAGSSALRGRASARGRPKCPRIGMAKLGPHKAIGNRE